MVKYILHVYIYVLGYLLYYLNTILNWSIGGHF